MGQQESEQPLAGAGVVTTSTDALQRLVTVADELCDAVDNAADDIGGSRPVNDILAELGPAVDAARLGSPPPIRPREWRKANDSAERYAR